MPLAAQFKNNARTGLLAKLGRGRYAAPATIAKVRPAEPRTERALYLRWVRSVFEIWTHRVLAALDLTGQRTDATDKPPRFRIIFEWAPGQKPEGREARGQVGGTFKTREAAERAVKTRQADPHLGPVRNGTLTVEPVPPKAAKVATAAIEASADVVSTAVRPVTGDLFTADWEELIDQSGFKGLLDRISTSIADRNQKYFTTIVKTPVPRIGAQSQMIEDFRDRNTTLIKGLGQKQIEDLNSTLSAANAQGLRHEEIRDQIKERLGVSESRAKLIARDQTLKYNSSVHTAQAKDAGIAKFRWSTSHDGAVRPMHRALDGEIFAYDDPPITNDDGDRNLPGEDYQCRCVALPIIDLFEGIDDAPVFDPSVLNP